MIAIRTCALASIAIATATLAVAAIVDEPEPEPEPESMVAIVVEPPPIEPTFTVPALPTDQRLFGMGHSHCFDYPSDVPAPAFKRAPPSRIAFEPPVVVGNLDKAIVRRYLQRQYERLAYCFDRAALTNQHATATFAISDQGSVTAARVDGPAADCLASVIETIQFPMPKDGGVTVTIQFELR